MDALVINAFIDATLHVVNQIAGLSPRVQKPVLKPETAPPGDVTGIIALTGDFQGGLALSFPAACILGIVSAWFGEEMTEMNDDIRDAVGEITNMICGQTNQKFVECRITSKSSLKEVVMGSSPPQETPYPVVQVPLELEAGAVTLEAGFVKTG